MKKNIVSGVVSLTTLCAVSIGAQADDQKPADPAPVSLSAPSMFGPLALSAKPYSIDAGSLGNIYASGIASGFGQWQDHHALNDHDKDFDLNNAQLMVQKIDGPVQFFVQAGGYTQAALGISYLHMDKATDVFYGPVPVAYVKVAPTDNFSVMAGKLYTLIGTENTFTFQNANIERGLLWNQTNAINRGIQMNYSQGPFSGSFSLSDGFYSGKLDWLSGVATYTINPSNSITLIASGNFDRNGQSNPATPLPQDNSQIHDLNYNYTTGPWTLSPTLQYTHVPKDTNIGLAASASTYGAGLTTKYTFNPHWSLASRAEYIDSVGGAASPNLVNGPGSNAWSLTMTPTYQEGIYFARVEGSYVKAINATPGLAFGANGNETTQARLMIETGVLF